MIKDFENHQIICSQRGIIDSLNKISKGSSRDRSQHQNDNGSYHRTNNVNKMKNLGMHSYAKLSYSVMAQYLLLLIITYLLYVINWSSYIICRSCANSRGN